MTTLTLYQTEITLERNARVENIDVYLNSLTPAYGPVDMQYLPLQGDMVIKLARDQEFSIISDCNYAKIEQDDKSFYFFVMGADWRAKKTVAFTLSMDTVNTWWDELSWNPKTTIQRQHGDRFYQTEDKLHLFRKIDRYNEGLNPSLTTGLSDYPVETALFDDLHTNWYLIYKARDDLRPEDTTNPVSVMLLSDESLLIKKHDAGDLNPEVSRKLSEWVQDNQIAWFTEAMMSVEGTGSLNMPGVDNGILAPAFPWKIGDEDPDNAGQYIRVMRIHNTHVGWFVDRFYYTGTTAQSYAFARKATAWYSGDNTTVLTGFAEYTVTSANTYYNKQLTDYAQINSVGDHYSLGGASGVLETIPFEQFDRANSKITKIIKLPYAPCMIYKANDIYHFPQGWEFNITYNAMELILQDQIFRSPLEDISLNDQFICELGSEPQSWNEYLNYGMESKLYNSEFYNLSVMYDNVSHQIKLERLEPLSTLVDYVPYIKPDFYISNSMSSNFLFDIHYWNATRDPEYPYDNYIMSTRNNEMPLYNSGYVDYLRNGYNYDQEANKQANRQQAIGAAISTVGTALTIATGTAGISAAAAALNELGKKRDAAKPKGNWLAWVTGEKKADGTQHEKPSGNLEEYTKLSEQYVEQEQKTATSRTYAGIQIAQSVTNSIASWYNCAESIIANNRNFQAGLAQKQAMAVNAQGSGDVDLMSIYAKNRLCVQEYSMREEDKINVARVFYYTGYNHPVQEIPNWSSRYWFNYVQCNARFNDEQTCVYHNYIEDIKMRFATGITVYHEHNGEYDFNQTKENWESFLID